MNKDLTKPKQITQNVSTTRNVIRGGSVVGSPYISKSRKASRKANRKYFRSNKGKIARNRYSQGEKAKNQNNQYRLRYPERLKAKDAVNNAIRSGKVPPLNTCLCECGEQAQEYHHPSYKVEHWLEVIPVCRICHKRIHLIELEDV